MDDAAATAASNPNSQLHHHNINHHQQQHYHGNVGDENDPDLRLALENPEEMDESQKAIVTEMCNVSDVPQHCY